MTKKFKVTLYEPSICRVRRFTYAFVWDGCNHCWECDGMSFAQDPADVVRRRGENMRHSDEYLTIKQY